MLSGRTPTEAVDTIVRGVQRYLELGGCQLCAIKLTASQFGLDAGKVETIWIDHNVAQLS